MSLRTYDIVVLGATGYSGALVCRHLAAAADGYKWAIAGRDKAKLDSLKQSLRIPDVPSIVANNNDRDSLDAMCRQATVVVACAGPFDLIGMNVVESCVRCGTHYVDITGEFQYVRKMIESFDAVARDKKVMLVPCVGFDCVPSELGNWLVHETAQQQQLGRVSSVQAFFAMKGGASGGTMASIAQLFNSMEKKDFSPVSLNPKGSPKVAAPRTAWVSFCKYLGRYQGPYIMAGINERIVRRSNALSGRGSMYVEASYGSFPLMLLTAVATYAFGLLLFVSPIRRLLLKYAFPTQGTGPSAESQAQGNFKGIFVGSCPETAQVIEVTVKDRRDAYTVTGVFAASSAMAVVDMTRGNAAVTGGVLTASTAFGRDLYDKLRAQGVEFSVTVKSAEKKVQ